MAASKTMISSIISEFCMENQQIVYDSDDEMLFMSTILTNGHRRQHVPKVAQFAEKTVQQYSSEDFRKDFRISRETFDKLLEKIGPTIEYQPRPNGKEPLSPEKQLLIYIWYISNLDSMREVSRLFGVSPSTCHKVVRRVSKAISTDRNFIFWPDQNEQQELAAAVEESSHIPGCVGFIDGTHVRLNSPPKQDNDYYNRKGFPSCQLQIVVDCNMLIRDAYCGWPGSTHDARVFRNSPIGAALSSDQILLPGTYIIGDSAYPLSKNLITPFKDNGRLSRAQKKFNAKVSSQRQVVERVIGHLKGRFRRLRDLDCREIEDIVYIIISACILHNVCVLSSENMDEFIAQAPDEQDGNNYINVFGNCREGTAKRNELVQYLQGFM